MRGSKSSEGRRGFLFLGGAGLLGILSVLAGRIARTGRPGRAQAEARRLVGRIDLPRGADSMMKTFARDSAKVERFRELTRWRQMRDKGLRKA